MEKIYKNFDHIELTKAIIEDSGYLEFIKKEQLILIILKIYQD